MTEEHRERLRDLTFGLAAGAASAASVALLALPGLPAGIALAAGAAASAAVGGVVLTGWTRTAVGDGADRDVARAQALGALATAHAAAAVPIGLAVLLAG